MFKEYYDAGFCNAVHHLLRRTLVLKNNYQQLPVH